MIYLDHNASSPIDDRVRAAMEPYLDQRQANAGSATHLAGHRARVAVEEARARVAALVAAEPDEVVFTSGATESNNLAILGTLAKASPEAELITTMVEHPSVLEPARRWGGRLRLAEVDSEGRTDPAQLGELIGDRTALVAVQAANNETGALQPLEEIAAICADAEVPLFSDVAQSAGRLNLRDQQKGVSGLSLSGHKMYGPKGIGALILRRRGPRLRLAPLMLGGGQERGLRPGTLNVPAIVGLGVAAEQAASEATSRAARCADLAEHLEARLTEIEPACQVNGPRLERRLPQTVGVRLPGLSAQALMRLLAKDLAISSGAACSSERVEPSHVLLAMGLSATEANESIRISFGPQTTLAELDQAVELIKGAAARVRSVRIAA